MMKNNFYANVFGWLFIGLLITFGSGLIFMSSPELLVRIFGGSGYIFIFIAQIIIAIVLSARINKMNSVTAKILYTVYTILTGVTFSSLFLIFKLESILVVFLVTAIIFGVFAIIGKTTKVDLSKIGTILFMSLLVIIILEVVNVFLMNNTLNMVMCAVSALIFMGYIAYDMQKLKRANDEGFTSDNMAIIFAFELYLDFINLFIDLLNLFGKER